MTGAKNLETLAATRTAVVKRGGYFFLCAAALAVTCVAPEIGNVLTIACAALGLALLRRQHVALLRRPLVWMPLVAAGLLAIAYAIASKSLTAIFGIYPFMPLCLATPMLALSPVRPWGPAQLASLALVGAAGGAAVAAYDFWILGLYRAGASVANPIHFADTVLAAGFLAAIGLFARLGPKRLWFLLGPMLGAFAVTLSGSRGALLAFPAVGAVAVGCVLIWRILPRIAVVTGLLLGLGLCAVLLSTGLVHLPMTERMTDFMDNSTQYRVSMYEGALHAFLQAPIFGYGPTDFVAAAVGQIAGSEFVGAPHLHNDLADFGVSGGILGLAAYALFLLAPIADILKADRRLPYRRAALFGAAMMATAFLVMGLTNAVFGILTLTVYYVVSGVALSVLARTEDWEVTGS